MTVQNILDKYFKILENEMLIDYRCLRVYEGVDNKVLKGIFASLHKCLMDKLKSINGALDSRKGKTSLNAQPSRDFNLAINVTFNLMEELKGSNYEFVVLQYYDEIFEKVQPYLKERYGSTIEGVSKEIDLTYGDPIFVKSQIKKVESAGKLKNYQLDMIGEGSYAYVYKYKDEFYNKRYAVKRAKKDLEQKEIERFKREFDIMSSLNSQYILEVFNYCELRNEYVMELLNCSLYDYIVKNNSALSKDKRVLIIKQILQAFNYLLSKDILHRDISPKNILLKLYDEEIVVKISDFGLVKIPDSMLTSLDTDFKGVFNDPALRGIGFSNYNKSHEIYALSKIIYFVITGKVKIDHSLNIKILDFYNKGTHIDPEMRYKTVEELSEAFDIIIDNI